MAFPLSVSSGSQSPSSPIFYFHYYRTEEIDRAATVIARARFVAFYGPWGYIRLSGFVPLTLPLMFDVVDSS